LPAGSIAAAPLDRFPRVLLWTLPALLVPAALWLALAAAHARRHDPLRPRREAHASLNKILARLETSDPASPSAAEDLLAWQRATAALFQLDSATPSARDLPDPLWSALWIETERALYRRATPLAPEWLAQARSALAAATPPARSALAALRPAHLFPRAAALLLASAALFSPTPADAATAAESYAAGDFPAAEKAWREAVSAAPLAWPARHNLALALAQQGQWDAAAAHAHAAALQAPSATEPRRLLDVVLPRASYRPAPPPAAARLLAPRAWQHLAFTAATLLALAPAAYLLAAYRRAPAYRIFGHTALVVSLATLVASLAAVRAYGPSAHPDAVLVWRDSTLRALPTDAGDQKVTADLPAGTLARVDKAFLGWRRLVMPDGTTGWVRAEPLVGLWRTP
jgi:tetratricopeptide (TPR) repeat protein